MMVLVGGKPIEGSMRSYKEAVTEMECVIIFYC